MPARLTSASFQRLIKAASMVQSDSPELPQMILTENPHAGVVRQQFIAAAARIGGDQAA